MFWDIFRKKRYFVEKFPYWGGGVFPRGNFSHIIPFFSEDVPYVDNDDEDSIDENGNDEEDTLNPVGHQSTNCIERFVLIVAIAAFTSFGTTSPLKSH